MITLGCHIMGVVHPGLLLVPDCGSVPAPSRRIIQVQYSVAGAGRGAVIQAASRSKLPCLTGKPWKDPCRLFVRVTTRPRDTESFARTARYSHQYPSRTCTSLPWSFIGAEDHALFRRYVPLRRCPSSRPRIVSTFLNVQRL